MASAGMAPCSPVSKAAVIAPVAPGSTAIVLSTTASRAAFSRSSHSSNAGGARPVRFLRPRQEHQTGRIDQTQRAPQTILKPEQVGHARATPERARARLMRG